MCIIDETSCHGILLFSSVLHVYWIWKNMEVLFYLWGTVVESILLIFCTTAETACVTCLLRARRGKWCHRAVPRWTCCISGCSPAHRSSSRTFGSTSKSGFDALPPASGPTTVNSPSAVLTQELMTRPCKQLHWHT